MLVPSRLARGPFFPQRPLCDLISASIGMPRQIWLPRMVSRMIVKIV